MLADKPIVDRDPTLTDAERVLIERARRQREMVAMAEVMAAANCDCAANPKAA